VAQHAIEEDHRIDWSNSTIIDKNHNGTGEDSKKPYTSRNTVTLIRTRDLARV
jgi:hypothetical protein